MKQLKFILVFACFVYCNQAWARKDVYQSAPFSWNTGLPALFSNQVPAPPINSLGCIQYRTKELNSYIKFWLKTEDIPVGMGSFTAVVTLQITYYPENPNGSLQTGITVNKTLTIDYNNTAGVKYKNVDVANFPNAGKIDVTVQSLLVTVAPATAAPATAAQQSFIGLQSFIEHERYYNYNNIFGGMCQMPFLPVPLATASIPNNEITISWNAEQYAEGYELEYTFVDDYSNNGPTVFSSPNQVNFSFRNNSTRILLEGTSYTMPVVQEHGYLVFRVRGYGMAGPNFDRIFFGGYNALVDGSQTFNVGTYPYSFKIDNNWTHTNDKINWQSITTFAEEGKSKTVVTYMDGTMRNRQTVTTTSTEHEAIVAETVYDFQGRPAVNILPAPVDNPAIKYYGNFNRNMQGQPFSAADFDSLDNSGCVYNINPLQQQNSIGAGNYYSKYNSNKQQFNAFIPEAEGYPFTRVTYMPDPTDRVVQQGNVGEVFQPGNTGINGANVVTKHPTKYYYGKPNQQELDRLFGTNVGYAEFYQKNLVVDPNGQSSVSYVDLDGKTIATALAGKAPNGMDVLASNSSMTLQVNLFSSADIVDNTNHSLTSSQSFNVTDDGINYHFSYDIKENVYNALSCGSKNYCLDCIYDLEIKLVNDECGTVIYQNTKTIGKLTNLNFLCNDASAMDNFSFDAVLNKGSHTISRKLIVNKQAAEFYADSILNDPKNKCLKTFDDFYEDAWNNRDTTQCKDACTSCNDDAQSAEDIANAVRECDSLWCKPQIATLCDIARMSMINDLRPGGQYGIYKDDNGNISFSFSPISVFNRSGNGINTLLNPTNTETQQLLNTIQITLPNNPTFYLSHYTTNTDSLQKLINNWPDDLSEQLLPFHPEYCYLKFCNQQYVQAGNAFDTRYMNAISITDAQTEFGNQVSAANINSFYTNDPFYIGLPASLKSQMAARFTNYTAQTPANSIVQLAVFLANCPSGNNINACIGAWGDGIKDDDEWEKFKAIYFSLKQEFIQKAREAYVQTNGCCSNRNIGCVAKQNCNIPLIFGNASSNCSSNQWVLYGNAEKRFVTINDINFPGVPDPTESIYDMTPLELADYIKTDSLQSPCPTCPELDAFKMMMWDIANKKLLSTGGSIKADAVIGLKDSLRQRLLGSQANDDITISRNGNSITISSKACTVSFTADTTINWEKADILPTCLEIKDYRHAKLHVMVNGEYKTALNLTSTCDLFYCYGNPPKPPQPDNNCKCDSVYDNKATYQIGNIISYKNVCYIVKKIDKPNGLTPGYYPGLKAYWEKLCDNSPAPCSDVVNIVFDGDQALNSQLTNVSSAVQPLTANKYTIRNNYTISGQNITSAPNPAVILYPTLNNQLLFQTTAALQANKNYTLSFDALLLAFGDPDCFNLIVEVNGQTLVNENCIQSRNNPLITRNGWYNYAVSFNTGNSSTATIRFISGKQNVSDIIAIKNIKLSCEGVASGNSGTTTTTTRYIPQSNCGCNDFCDIPLPSPEMELIPCDSILKDIATQQALDAYSNYRDSVYNAILNGYYAHCMNSIETFNMEYKTAEYHYTLYYYDQSGNLVRTVPPAGVIPFTTQADLNTVAARRTANGAPYVPNHLMPTTYRHNSLNAVVWQKTPDAGISNFFYDQLGRIVLSQNAKQANINPTLRFCSYTTYDRLGRTVEAGVVRTGPLTLALLKASAFNYATWTNFIVTKPRTEITKTYYDNPAKPRINIAFGSNGQMNLRNRIASVFTFPNNTKLAEFENDVFITQTSSYTHATHYSYDIAGNVIDLLQDFGIGSDFGSSFTNVRTQSKHINYRFDLVSGKVNRVNYQPGMPDQFIYQYRYNADNKLTHVFTSANGLIWENDARYFYYRHGPLARTEYGTDKVQGVDLAFTLQGWIKGANGYSEDPGADIGKDGNATVSTVGYSNENKSTAPDVFSYWLGYHKDDYTAIAGNSGYVGSVLQPLQSGNYHTNAANLFNGNIRSMYTRLQPFGGLGMHYTYDQLNRIKKQDAFDFATNSIMANNAYSMQLEYDPNGNIQKLLRNGTVAATAMDDLKYFYYNDNNTMYQGNPALPNATNKLAYVTDAVGPTAITEDIETQPVANYRYDAIGNLIVDAQEGLSINWNVQNKITYIKKTNGKDIRYSYDALGNRIKKEVASGTPGIAGITQYYVRDAQGNTLAIYEMKTDDLHWAEQHIYGSSRLGMYKPDVNMVSAVPLNTSFGTTRNSTQYELTNHLGNVLATITDSRTNSNTATISTATDYYAFGIAMPGRTYTLNNTKLRYGFNGKENDIETNTQDYGFRIYNPGLGRFLSVDPLTQDYPWYTTYQFAGNNPIQSIDLDGLEPAPKYTAKNGVKISGSDHLYNGNAAFKLKPKQISKPKKTEAEIVFPAIDNIVSIKPGVSIGNENLSKTFEINSFSTESNSEEKFQNISEVDKTSDLIIIGGGYKESTRRIHKTVDIVDPNTNKIITKGMPIFIDYIERVESAVVGRFILETREVYSKVGYSDVKIRHKECSMVRIGLTFSKGISLTKAKEAEIAPRLEIGGELRTIWMPSPSNPNKYRYDD